MAGGVTKGGAPRRAAEPATASVAVFEGRPTASGGEAVLFDSRDRRRSCGRDAVRSAAGRVPGGAPDVLDAGLCLLLYVGDLATPAARVRLATWCGSAANARST
jgi:hypothetical protein